MPISDFTYEAYGALLSLIYSNNYRFVDYHDFNSAEKPCILRHDVDMDLEYACKMASFEASLSFPEKALILFCCGLIFTILFR